MVELASSIWREYVTDGVPSSGPSKPRKSDVRAWGTRLESLANLALTSGRVYATKAALTADLVPEANTPAIVATDPVAANNGLYTKVGATTTGSWTQLLPIVPGTQFVTGTDSGAGTPDAIQVSTNLPVAAAGGQIIVMNVYEPNASAAPTVSFNGGSALTIKKQGGGDFLAGELPSLVLGFVSGSTFRSVFDLPNETTLAAIEDIADTFGDLDSLNTAMATAVAQAQDILNSTVAVADAYAARDNYAVLLIEMGQSLSMRRSPRVTTATSPLLQTFNGGSQQGDQAGIVNGDYIKIPGNFDSLVSFAENAAGEGHAGGAGYQWLRDPLCRRVVFFCCGGAGRDWRQIKDGTGYWKSAVVALKKGRDLLNAAGYSDDQIKIAITWTHGEADSDTVAPGGALTELAVTQAQYFLILKQVRDKIRYDLASIFGKDMSDVPIFVTPMNSQSFTGGGSPVQASYIDAIGAGGLVIMPPHWQNYLDMETDGVHLGGQGRRHHAELEGYIQKRVLIQKAPYQAPYFKTAVRAGATVVLTYATPDGSDMVIDTTTFANPANGAGQLYGIQMYDTSAAGFATISSVVVSGKTVTITPNVTPAAGDIIMVGQQPWPGGTNAATQTPRSNLRCLGLPVTAEDGTTRYHYALPQRTTLA